MTCTVCKCRIEAHEYSFFGIDDKLCERPHPICLMCWERYCAPNAPMRNKAARVLRKPLSEDGR